MESLPVLCDHLFWKYKVSSNIIQKVTCCVFHYILHEIQFKARSAKYAVTTGLL